jgi:hypothetical protein
MSGRVTINRIARAALARELRAAGVSIKVIALDLGCHVRTVMRILEEDEPWVPPTRPAPRRGRRLPLSYGRHWGF